MSRNIRIAVAGALVLILFAGLSVAVDPFRQSVGKTHLVAFFDNSSGIFVGDDVRILGVRVGEIDVIQPEPQRVRISFWVNKKYKIPADAKAVVLSPQLVTARAIQLTPVYTGGSVMADGAVIPRERTAVPVEWDDLRQELEKLTNALRPTQPGGVSTLGAFINTAADNLRGEGPNLRDTVVKLSQVFAALGDHSTDIFSTVKNLATLVSALRSSTDLMAQLNRNLSTVSALLANDSDEVGRAVQDLDAAARDVTSFVADNRESIGTSSDKLASISQLLEGSLGDIKDLLHGAPTTIQNLNNIYQPAQGTLTGALALNNFANPLQFLCGAIEAASRLGADKASKLCVQYMAAIFKNRQINYFPIGENLFVGATARPNELTYSEDWMRPDFVPPQPPPAQNAPPSPPLPAEAPPPPAGAAGGQPPAPVATDPTVGLRGLFVPPGAGS